jgi:hypothetical protein
MFRGKKCSVQSVEEFTFPPIYPLANSYIFKGKIDTAPRSQLPAHKYIILASIIVFI